LTVKAFKLKMGPQMALIKTDRILSMWRILQEDYHLPEDDNHHSHRRGNLKSYTILQDFRNGITNEIKGIQQEMNMPGVRF
jgi:hypothetical protein